VKIIQTGANHSILLENHDQKDLVYSTLEEWIGNTIQESATTLHKDIQHREELIPLRN